MSKPTAIITGGGGAMGLACARRLAARYQILLAEIEPDRLDRAQEQLSAHGVQAAGLAVDVCDEAQVGRLAEMSRQLGAFGTLVHTAGLSPTMASGERIWQVNLVGSALLLRALRPLVGPGCVAILIASQAAHFLRDNSPPELNEILADPLAENLLEKLREFSPDWFEPGAAYAATKLGVLSLAVRTALDWGPMGGRVVSLSPGIIDTTMGQQEYAAQPFMKTMVERTPLRRMGEDHEIACVVEFLCSDSASFITATDLLVDGGSTAAVRHMVPGPLSD